MSTELFGVDTTEEIPVDVLHEHGVKFVCRYLSRGSWKIIRPGEGQRMHAAGIGIVANFEDSATNSLRGYDQGASDAQFAVNQAVQLLGKPPQNRPIIFSVDFDTAGNPGATDSYFDGCASIIGHDQVGAYGGIELVTHFLNRGYHWGWQTYAWSRGQFNDKCQLYQYDNEKYISGHNVDFDKAFAEDYGDWYHAPAQPPLPKDTTMSATAMNQNGKMESFVMLADGTVKHLVQATPGGAWTNAKTYSWTPLGKPGHGSISVAANHDGRLELFVHLDDGNVKHIGQDKPNSDWWKDKQGNYNWLALGNPGK